MADWDLIQCGFNTCDETMNFGTRTLAGIDNLYETATLATLKNTDDISTHIPNIHALIKNGLVIFSINKTIRIFETLSCTEMTVNATFDDEIDVICSNGSVLLLCFRNGTVHCFNLENDFNILCSRQVVETSNTEEAIFVEAFVEDISTFILVSKCGSVYRLSIDESNQESTCDIIVDLKSSIKSANFAYPKLYLSSESFHTYDVQADKVTSDDNTSNLKRLCSLGYGKVLALQSDGCLVIYCTNTYLCFCVNTNTLYDDISLLCDTTGYRILGITKNDDNSNVHLQLLDFSSLTVIFSIKLTQEICLVIPDHIHDEILYISLLKSQESVSELRFQAVSETNPDNRLQRLLKRQKFEEAEQFAKLFNLDLKDLQKAKAQAVADKLVCEKEDINYLINIMNQIDDTEFKIEICLITHLCCDNLPDVERILKYGCLCAQSDLEVVNNCQYLYDTISQSLFRFQTFLELSKCGRENGNVQGWNNFSSCDLIAELCNALNHHRIEEAIIIYNRLDTVTIYELNENTVDQILQLVNNIPMEVQLPFLYTFMPLTLSYLPSSLHLFIKWMLDKVIHIEMKEPNKFPEKAIDFLESMIQLLKLNCSKIVSFEMPHMIDQSALNDLSDRLHALEVMKTLKLKYRIFIPFQEFLQGRKALALVLLSGPAGHIIGSDSFFEEFIQTFILDSKLKPDEILGELVKDIVQYQEELWIKVAPVILNCIYTIGLKLESVLCILKAANLPWSDAVRQIAQNALQYSHSLVNEIANEIEYEPKCVILNKEPYKLNLQHFNSIEYVKFAIGRIIYFNLPSMVDDIFQICKDSEERHEANMALIKHFIEIGENKTALEILDNNKIEETVSCCKKLAIIATSVINNDYFLYHLQEKYYDIIGCIFNRLLNNTDCDFEKLCLQDTLENLRSTYKIRRVFNINITTHQLALKNQMNEILDNLINQTIIETPDTSECFMLQQKIAIYFRLNEHTILLKYCQQVGDFNIILQVAERLYENENDTELLCCAVTLILKYIGLYQVEFDDVKDFTNYQNIDINLLVVGLKLARKMIIKAILASDEADVNSYIELANWIQTTYFLTQDYKRNYSADLRNEYGIDYITVPSAMAFNALRDTLQLYTKFMGNCITRSTSYLTFFTQNQQTEVTELELYTELQSLFPTVKCLCTEGQALVAFKLVLALQRGLMYHTNINPSWFEVLEQIVKHCVQQVQHKIFSLKHIDKDFAYNLLLLGPQNARTFLSESLRMYKRDVEKFQTIAEIYLRFLKHFNSAPGQELCSKIICMVKWWKTIKNCPIPYDKFFSREPNDLLEKLMKLNQLNLSSIEEFCLNFGIDQIDSYKVYLKYLLINWKADVEISECGKRTIVVKNNEEELFKSCLAVIQAINDNEAVLEITNHLWKTVSFYHYEVFICMLKMRMFLNPNLDHSQQKMLLLFLMSYERVSKPGQAEVEEWYTFNPESHTIDFLSEWRLPFTRTLFTGNIWNIIRPEVNLKTYPKWFDAISFLKKNLSKDDICSYVIKEVVSSGTLQSLASDTWIMHSKHNDLIQEVNECVQHISNLERATSAVYLLATSIPGGADQVNIISLCYKYALLYKDQRPDSEAVQRAVTKVQNKYYSISVTHILYKNKLAEKSYLEMVSHPPDELIDTLYMDERICKKALLATLHCPDINKAVDEISTLYNYDIAEKRHSMIKTWISSDLSSIGSGDSNVDEENLIRASYVCTSGDINNWRAWLLKLGEVKSSTRNFNFKARALKCFCNISESSTVEKLTNSSYESFRGYIDKLIIVSSLESFGFGLTTDALDKANKYDLLSRLAFRVGNTVGSKTMASVCITYNITEVKYWNLIITAMLKLNMIEEVKRCIYFLKNCSQYHNLPFYIEAWQKVIDRSFEFSFDIDEPKIMNLCISNFSIIQSCPVFYSLKLENVASKCIQMKKYEFVVLLLRHLPVTIQRSYALEIIEKEKDVDKKAQQLSRYGFWGISQACLFLSEITVKHTLVVDLN